MQPLGNSKMENLHIQFELPTVLASQAGINLENPAPEIRKMVALFLYEHHRISLGKACEIGGFSYWEFAEMNRQLGIPAPYSQKDFEDDMARMADV